MTRRLAAAIPAGLIAAGCALSAVLPAAASPDRPMILAQGAPIQLGPPAGGAAPARPQGAPAAATGALTPPVRHPAPRGARGVDASAREIAQQVNAYFNGIRTLQGDFVQIGPDGRRTTGKLYLEKPGRIRFQYNAPSPVEIVADGQSVAVRDRRLNTQDIYPLSQTPLRFLLSDRIDLLKDTNVVSVTADDVFISVTIEEKQALIGTSRLMLMVGAKDGQLKQWTVTDPQGYDTTVAVYNLDPSKKVDPGLFKIDFTNYSVPPG